MDHRLHGLLTQRAAGVAGVDQGLRRLFPARPGHAPRGQGRRRFSPPLRQPLRHDSSAGVRRELRRAHLAFLLAGPDPLGRASRPAARAARRLVGRQQDRPEPSPAGDAGGLVDPLPRRAANRGGMFVSPGTRLARPGRPAPGPAPQRRMGLRARDALRAAGGRQRRGVSLRLGPGQEEWCHPRLRLGSPVVFTKAHIHSLPRGLPAHEP